ncbi:MAG: hypothetical protein M0R21_12135 [Lentimicrobiaceae bacterium]|nr:hypothetical protein [Lentimicrobiaceae bacterium]
MKKHLIYLIIIPVFFCSCNSRMKPENPSSVAGIKIGWASADITPAKSALLRGQFHARVSEAILDPLTVTALAIESGKGQSSQKVIMVSCDLININDFNEEGSSDNLLDNVRNLLKESLPELRSERIFMNATHTHTAPYLNSYIDSKKIYGIELDALSPSACVKYISERIAKAAREAWESRKPGGISFGLGQAVVGHNRVEVDFSGNAMMYGGTNRPVFSHVEGYEDHSVNLLYTWNNQRKLTGVVINIACPSQVTSALYKISADFWHDTRKELSQRLGKGIYFLPQCSSAGDQSPDMLVGKKAEERMQRIMQRDSAIGIDLQRMEQRKQVAIRIADAVTSVLPYMKENIEWNPVVDHRMSEVNLTRRHIGISEVDSALKKAAEWKIKYEQMLLEIKKNPSIREKPHWYKDVTQTYRMMERGYLVKERYELEKRQPKMATEIHVLRIGDVVFATNPFELYLDFGMRIKGRSPAIQTFLVQLSGSGTYLPSSRSVAGGAYGADPASNLIGPEGGQELVEKTLEMINSVWK